MRSYPVKKNPNRFSGKQDPLSQTIKQTDILLHYYKDTCLDIIKAGCYQNGSTDLVKELLDAGANIEERSLSDHGNLSSLANN